MAKHKAPAWEKAGRPKPEEIALSSVYDLYAKKYGVWNICKERISGEWLVYRPNGECKEFTSFKKAIKYADRKARG